MSYSFGWWDFVEGDQPAMVNRYSEERIVRRGALAPGEAPADEPWVRFDYVADDLTYPLAVRWAPEHGEILLDHNKSAEIWRRETGAGVGPPPFGTFVRVDDLVPDALWCWPGVIEAHFRRLVEDEPSAPPRHFHRGPSPLTLFRVGGYQNGSWQERLVSEEANDVHFSPLMDGSAGSLWGGTFFKDRSVSAMIRADDFRQAYEQVPRYSQRVFLAPDAPAPSPLFFVDPISCPDFGVDYPEWMHQLLAKDPWPRPGQDLTVNEPMTPHAVSLDRKRLVRHPWTYAMSGHGSTVRWALRLDFMGLPVAATQVVPGIPHLLGPYMGGPYFSETSWVCGLDGLEPSVNLPDSGIARLPDYDGWLSEHTMYSGRLSPATGMDVSLQQRDLIDALFLFTRVAAHGMPKKSRLNRPADEQKFDCIASSARFLGGRLVNSRIKFNYIATV